MKNFRKQAKRVKDLRWQIVRWNNALKTYGNDKYRKRIKYYTKQYEVALKRLKTM